MPEIKRNFSAGKMNKDFDERLLPNGEYRSAINVEVTTTSSGEIGTVRNIKGNELIKTFKNSGLTDSEITNIFNDTFCVGSIADEKNDYYYWLVTEEELVPKAFGLQAQGFGVSTTLPVNTPTMAVAPENRYGIPAFVKRDMIFRSNTKDNTIEPVFVDLHQQTRNIDYFATTQANDEYIYFQNNSNGDPVTNGLEVGMDVLGYKFSIIQGNLVQVLQPNCKILEIDFANNRIKLTNSNHYINFKQQEPPVVVFRRNKVLGFERNRLITGINIIDDMLFITDNKREPKKIKITESIEGTDFTCEIHSEIENKATGEIFPAEESHLTVIRKSPTRAPRIEALTDSRGGLLIGEAEFVVKPENQFIWVKINGDSVLNIKNNYKVNDILLFSTSIGSLPANPNFKAKIVEIDNSYSSNYRLRVRLKIISQPVGITVNIVSSLYCELEQILDPLFQLRFVRFGYRYKYLNNEVSCYSPFTEPVFYPDNYLYNPIEGDNEGMKNTVKEIILKQFDDYGNIPKDVKQIDILFKDESSPNIYCVDTLRPDDIGPDGTIDTNDWNLGYYKIRTENIYAALPTNQILRSFDNVPRYAKAQEIAANRLIYANYVQNYDMQRDGENIKPSLDVGFEKRIGEWDYNTRSIQGSAKGRKSLKTLRTYELGVTYQDDYNRNTPVFTNANASVKIPQNESLNSNALFAQLKNDAPDFAKSFKVYVKETSSEYYNIPLDRIYDAGDNCVWLSFASDEVNKIAIEDYLILKKKPISSSATSAVSGDDGKSKFKVLAISDQVPDSIKQTKKLLARITGNITEVFRQSTIAFHPDEADIKDLVFDKEEWEGRGGGLAETTVEAKAIRFEDTASGITSKEYEIDRIYPDFIGAEEVYRIRLGEGLDQVDADWITNNNTASTTGNGGTIQMISTLGFSLFAREEENLKEYDGRFFVKIKSNEIIEQDLAPQIVGSTLRTSVSLPVYYMADEWAPMWEDTGYWGGFPIYNSFAGMNLTNTNFDSFTALSIGQHTTRFHTNSAGVQHGNYVSHRFSDWVLLLDVPGPNNSKWFIDQAYYAQRTSPSSTSVVPNNPNTWRYGHGFGRGIFETHGGNRATMELAFAGIYLPDGEETDDTGYHEEMWNVGEPSNPRHDEERVFISKFRTGQKFRFAEDPNGQIYHIHAVSGPYRRYNHTSLWEARGWRDDDMQSNDRNKLNDSNNEPSGGQRFDIKHHNTGISGPQSHHISSHIAIINSGRISMASLGADEWIGGGPNVVWNNFLHDSGRGTSGGGTTIHHDINNSNQGGRVHPYFQGFNPYDAGTGSAGGNTFEGSDSDLYYADGAGPGSFNNFGLGNNPTSTETMAYHEQQNVAIMGHASNRRVYWNFSISPSPLQQAFNPIADGNSSPNETVSIQFLEQATDFDLEQETKITAAVFETEPRENTDLDIYYEASNQIPTYLHGDTNELFAPLKSVAYSDDTWADAAGASAAGAGLGDHIIPFNPCSPVAPPTCIDDVVYIQEWKDNVVTLFYQPSSGSAPSPFVIAEEAFLDEDGNYRDIEIKFYKPLNTHTEDNYISAGSKMAFNDDWVSTTISWDQNYNQQHPVSDPSNGKYYLDRDIHTKRQGLSWYNCFSFNNGVESDRIRDDFNATQILNGVKASSITLEPYQEERRANGLIYSGLYNSNSAVNDLNQFIMAEKITKDLNPDYGSIQKLFTRDTDLISFCEDRVLRVLANKDALFNADGNAQLTATQNVLGQAVPFSGDYGISKNPESFASDSYRCYFADKQRGAVLRLSRDGLTPISDYGMKAWFDSNLRVGEKILGSFDTVKREYNISITNEHPQYWKSGERTAIDWTEVPAPDNPIQNI